MSFCRQLAGKVGRLLLVLEPKLHGVDVLALFKDPHLQVKRQPILRISNYTKDHFLGLNITTTDI